MENKKQVIIEKVLYDEKLRSIEGKLDLLLEQVKIIKRNIKAVAR